MLHSFPMVSLPPGRQRLDHDSCLPFRQRYTNVHLAGSIKTVTKNKWYYILDHEYRERKWDFRTHRYDHSKAFAVILDRSMRMASIHRVDYSVPLTDCTRTPRCFCAASCQRNNRPSSLDKFDHDEQYVPFLEMRQFRDTRVTTTSPNQPVVVHKPTAYGGVLWSKVHMVNDATKCAWKSGC
jgi:hypothetical protein